MEHIRHIVRQIGDYVEVRGEGVVPEGGDIEAQLQEEGVPEGISSNTSISAIVRRHLTKVTDPAVLTLLMQSEATGHVIVVVELVNLSASLFAENHTFAGVLAAVFAGGIVHYLYSAAGSVKLAFVVDTFDGLDHVFKRARLVESGRCDKALHIEQLRPHLGPEPRINVSAAMVCVDVEEMELGLQLFPCAAEPRDSTTFEKDCLKVFLGICQRCREEGLVFIDWMRHAQKQPKFNDEDAHKLVTGVAHRNEGKGILLIDTGGTFSMEQGPEGSLVVAPPEKIYNCIKDLFGNSKFSLELTPTKVHDVHYSPFPDRIDSSSATPEVWLKLAKFIRDRRKKYGAFVVIHGTDTLAYTSAALAFFLNANKIDKAIIVTGAQTPLLAPHSDARSNLMGALEFAVWRHSQKPECKLVGAFVVFNHLLMRATTVVKVDSQRFAAFDSPRVPILGEIKDGKAIVIEHGSQGKNAISLGTRDEAGRIARCERETAELHKGKLKAGGSAFDEKWHSRESQYHERRARTISKGLEDWAKLPDMVTKKDYPVVELLYPGVQLRSERWKDHSVVIIVAHGTGNGPEEQKEAILEYVDGGGCVACVTECLCGTTGFQYDTSISRWDKKERIVMCANMTLASVYAKATYYAVMYGEDEDTTFEWYMSSAFCGEMMFDQRAGSNGQSKKAKKAKKARAGAPRTPQEP